MGGREGCLVGALEGDFEVGDGVSMSGIVGGVEGFFVGASVGETVGDADGEALGEVEGFLVGEVEGRVVGDVEGDFVGEVDGTPVGFTIKLSGLINASMVPLEFVVMLLWRDPLSTIVSSATLVALKISFSQLTHDCSTSKINSTVVASTCTNRREPSVKGG